MSTQPQAQEEPVAAEAIEQYLQANPEFFSTRPELVAGLRIPHACGTAVSLLEHQVLVLREKIVSLREDFNHLIEVGHENQALGEKLHRVTLALIGCAGTSALVPALQDCMAADFDADAIALLRYTDIESADPAGAGTLRVIARSDPGLQPFERIISSNHPRCASYRRGELDFLFGAEPPMASAALLPLGEKGANGLFAIGSRNPERYAGKADTHFLEKLAELVGASLQCLPAEPA